MSYENNIVKKPWGYEYLMYENEKVALWFLHIKNGEKTSMHCHPNKTTGLVLLDGEAEVSFLSNKNKLTPLSKIMIRKGLFHSTQAISNGGAYILENENGVSVRASGWSLSHKSRGKKWTTPSRPREQKSLFQTLDKVCYYKDLKTRK